MAKGKKGKAAAKKGKGGKKGKGSKKSSKPSAPPFIPAPLLRPSIRRSTSPPKPTFCDYREDEGLQEVYCKPNKYPDVLKTAQQMAIVATDKNSYESLCKVMNAGFGCADRVLLLTRWGSFVAYRYYGQGEDQFYLHDGCTCNANVFRYLDLSTGTAGFLAFKNMHSMLLHILNARFKNAKEWSFFKRSLDDICCRRSEDTDMCCNRFSPPPAPPAGPVKRAATSSIGSQTIKN